MRAIPQFVQQFCFVWRTVSNVAEKGQGFRPINYKPVRRLQLQLDGRSAHEA